jgi:hypothetical protein
MQSLVLAWFRWYVNHRYQQGCNFKRHSRREGITGDAPIRSFPTSGKVNSTQMMIASPNGMGISDTKKKEK